MHKKSTAVALALAFAGSSLAACGGNDAKLPKPKAATGVAYPAMSTERFGKVQKKVFTAISQADGSLNADALTARVTGPMKTIRSAQYKLKGILNDGYTLTELSTLTSRQGIAVSGDGSFPRLGFSVMEPVKGTTLPSFDVFLQSTARNNWALWGSLYVEAGATLPSVKVGKSGLELIGAESNGGLAAGPAQTVAAYVQLNNTRSDAKGLTFANDKLRTQLAAAHDENAKSVSASGTVSTVFGSNPKEIYSVRTEDGGALVVSEMGYNIQHSLTQPNGKITLTGIQGVMATGNASGSVNVTGTTTSSYTMLVAFHVPPANAKDKTIRLVGSSIPQLTSVG